MGYMANKTVISGCVTDWDFCSRIAGQSFYGFFRWTNLTTPANNGPWSDAQPVVIA